MHFDGLAYNNYEQTVNYLCTFLHFFHTFFIVQYNFYFTLTCIVFTKQQPKLYLIL